MNKTRCSHKGCIRHSRRVMPMTARRNRLEQTHDCCGACCPKTTTTIKKKGKAR